MAKHGSHLHTNQPPNGMLTEANRNRKGSQQEQEQKPTGSGTGGGQLLKVLFIFVFSSLPLEHAVGNEHFHVIPIEGAVSNLLSRDLLMNVLNGDQFIAWLCDNFVMTLQMQ